MKTQRQRMATYLAKHPEYVVRNKQRYWKKVRADNAALKLEVMTHYCGGEPHCQCPGCSTRFIRFLQMDHVNGDGSKHLKNGYRLSGATLLHWLKENNYPEGFQVLCCNCNGMGSKSNKKACALYGQPHY